MTPPPLNEKEREVSQTGKKEENCENRYVRLITESEARFTESKTRFSFSFTWFGFGFVLIWFRI